MSAPRFGRRLPHRFAMPEFLKRAAQFRLSVLHKYLLLQNVALASACIVLGVCIYLLQDLVETLDSFVHAGVGLSVVTGYFAAKVPLIISQVLPATYLVALILQIGLMARNRELLALQAGGVSFLSLVRFFCVYGLLWCMLQLFFSQALAVEGQRSMNRIWQEQVRKEAFRLVEVKDVWFLNGPYVVNLEWADPHENHGRGVTVYEYGEGSTLQRVIKAESFTVQEQGWDLNQAAVHEAVSFASHHEETLTLGITQDLEAFAVLHERFEPGALSLRELGRVISYLEGAGSNVERLRTAWHMKWAYAFSLFIMTLIALALATLLENVYANIAVGLGIVFIYYVLFVLGVSLGERGFISPFLGAWLGNIVFCTLAGARLLWYFAPDDLAFVQARG